MLASHVWASLYFQVWNCLYADVEILDLRPVFRIPLGTAISVIMGLGGARIRIENVHLFAASLDNWSCAASVGCHVISS